MNISNVICSEILKILRKGKRSGYWSKKTEDCITDILHSESQMGALKHCELKEIVRYMDRYTTSKLRISGSKQIHIKALCQFFGLLLS